MEPRKKRERGTGSVYTNDGSPILWVKFYDRGRARRESSHSTDPKVAEKLLRRRLGEVEIGSYIPRQNIKLDELITDAINNYRVNNRKSRTQVERRWRVHLSEFFSRMKASDLRTEYIQRYINRRLDQGAARATVNRELAIVKFALRLAFKSGKLKTLVYVPMLRESNVRRGFLEPDGYARLTAECATHGLWLRALVETAYSFGFRLGELQSMRVKQVNLLANTISLETSKNGEPREVYMTASVRQLLMALIVGRKPDDFVFVRDDGRPVGNFRKLWANCCVAAGVGAFHCPTCNESVTVAANQPTEHCERNWRRSALKYRGLIFHDLRRCAVRGLIRAGVSQKVAMAISGHKTISTFQRYQIVAPADRLAATRMLEASQEQERELLKKSQAPSFGQDFGQGAAKPGQTGEIGIPAEAPRTLAN